MKIIKCKLMNIKDSLEEYQYWNSQNDNDVLDIIKEDIKFQYKVLKGRIEKISSKTN